eukprot:gene6256-12665_t
MSTGEFADDELPLPSFVEVFGDGNSQTILASSELSAAARKNKTGRKSGIKGGGSGGEESTGRWTPDEQRRFLEGLMLYGKDWKKMAPLIKTRTLVQIRTHAQKVFKKMGLRADGNKKRIPKKRGRDDGEEDMDDLQNKIGRVGSDSNLMLNGDDDDDGIEIDEQSQAHILSQISAHEHEEEAQLQQQQYQGQGQLLHQQQPALHQQNIHQLQQQQQQMQQLHQLQQHQQIPIQVQQQQLIQQQYLQQQLFQQQQQQAVLAQYQQQLLAAQQQQAYQQQQLAAHQQYQQLQQQQEPDNTHQGAV